MNNKLHNKENIMKNVREDFNLLDYDLASVLRASMDGIAINSIRREFIFVNYSLVKMYGYGSPDELLGKSWKLLYDKDEIMRFDEIIMPEFFKSGFWRGDAVGIKKDGTKFFQDVTLTLTGDGRIIRVVRDITLRKNAEKNLEESELKYRSLFNNLQDAVFYVDNDGKMLYANRRCSELFGYKPEELIGIDSFELLYDKKDIAYLQEKNRQREEGLSDSYELRCRKKTGKLIWCSVNGTPYRDINGKVIGSITIINDITKQKLFKDALKESERKFQAIFETSVDAIGVSRKGNNILINPAFISLFGYEKSKEIEGKPESILIVPDERDRIMEYTNKRLRGEPAPASYITRGLRKDGTEFTLEIHVSTYQLGGELYNISILRDITELENAEKALRESEEKYRTLVNISPDAIFVIHLDGEIIFMNQKAVEIFGVDNAGELIGKDYFKLMIKEDELKARENAKEVIIKNFALNIERTMIRKDGSQFPAEISVSVGKDSGGIPVTFIVIIRDISDRKQFEEQLRKYAEEQAEMNATKDKFYSVIAHDLRSPFQSLIGYSDMLKSNIENLKPAKISGFAKNIFETSSETYNFLEDLLQWTALQTGRVKVNPEIIYVTELFNSVIKTFREAAKNKKIALMTEITKPSYIYADKKMVTTVLRNLVSNAIKFTKRRGKIILDVKERGNKIFISVTDTGTGITKENISKLFKIDSTFTTKGTEKEKGSGLGLIVCKEFTEMNHGELSVKSKPGKGSKFILSLPKKGKKL